MLVRYREARSESDSEQRLEELFKLFSYLLLKTSGDVDEALEWIEYLDENQGILGEMSMQEFVEELRRAGLIERSQDRLGGARLTEKGKRKLRKDSLQEIFALLKKGPAGDHRTPHPGGGVEQTGDLKDYRFGDPPSSIDASETLSNAFRRDGNPDRFSLREEDIRIRETELTTSVATVLMIDISHSMILYGEDRITPAKRVALALAELIMTRFPKDRLDVVLFGDDALEVPVAEIPFISVGPFHTNTRAGLQMARSLLRRSRNANRQIFMVTDGKPSAMYERSGRLYKNSWGLDPRIVNKTLDEAVACRREGITISTFMVAQDPYLVDFVESMTRANNGRAYYSGLGKLGETVFVDYMRNRRKQFRDR